jgi:hypothetical protein
LKNILVSNFHTPYVFLLSKVFSEFDCINGWDYDQRPLPANVGLIEKPALTYKVFISNNALADIKILLKRSLLLKKNVIVIHGELNRGCKNKPIRRLLKFIFYKLISIFPKNNIVCIQRKVKESYSLKKAIIITPGAIQENIASKNKKNEILLIGNRLDREHFNQPFIDDLLSAQVPVKVIGRDNDKIKKRHPKATFIIPKDYNEYINILNKAKFCLNTLQLPEAPYNLSIIEAVRLNCVIIQLHRPDSILNEKSAIVIRNIFELKSLNLDSDYSDRVKNANNKVDNIFSMENFTMNWRNLIEKV